MARRDYHTREMREYVMSTLGNHRPPRNTPEIPIGIQDVRNRFQRSLERGDRVIVSKHIYNDPQSSVVVTLDKCYNRFVLGHTTNRLNGEHIPYTINYFMLFDKNSKYVIKIEGESERGYVETN